MSSRLFSEYNIVRFFNAGSMFESEEKPYSNEEAKQIDESIEKVYQHLTSSISPASDEDREFVIALGAPGAGKSTYLERFVENSEKEFAHADMDLIREEFDLYKNARIDSFNQGASPAEADDYAYGKYRNAAMVVARRTVNRLFEDGYNMAYPFQSAALNRDTDFLPAILERGDHLKFKVFLAPYDQLESAVEQRTKETGREIGNGYLDAQYTALNSSIQKALDTGENTEFYWRQYHDSEPVLAAKIELGALLVENEEAMTCCLNEMNTSYDQLEAMARVGHNSKVNDASESPSI